MEMTEIDEFTEYLSHCRPVLVLTGAGCSTGSGIPDYRDCNGEWKQVAPVQYREFLGSENARRRYWARSMNGWPRIARARPNAAHRSLARLENLGLINLLVTQNVDGLHRRAGSREVLDLHGSLHTVSCLSCGYRTGREKVQESLQRQNAGYMATGGTPRPDGDVQLESTDLTDFVVPECPICHGIVKPDVVFFGEAVPAVRVRQAATALKQAGCLMVVGSSLMLYSGYRFCLAARQRGIPVIAVNLGRTRADTELTLKVETDCESALSAVCEKLNRSCRGDIPDTKALCNGLP